MKFKELMGGDMFTSSHRPEQGVLVKLDRYVGLCNSVRLSDGQLLRVTHGEKLTRITRGQKLKLTERTALRKRAR